jgi:hypothetical protein
VNSIQRHDRRAALDTGEAAEIAEQFRLAAGRMRR